VAKRASSPATKQDIEDFANLIGGYCVRAEQKIDDLEGNMQQWKQDLFEEVRAIVDEGKREMGSANRDELQVLKDRLERIEIALHFF
jgi:hypothetical protein